MNVKPGDIAIIVHPSEYGRLVEVLYAAPTGSFTLPDGMAHEPQIPGSWVIVMLGSPVDVQYNGGGTRLARYASCHDKWLRPIRDMEGDDVTLTWAERPDLVHVK